MKPINAKRLEKLKACRAQVTKFRSIFGEADAPLDVKTAIEHASIFDWNWASTNLLSKEGQKAFQEATALHRRVYNEAGYTCWEVYDEAKALYSALYSKAYDEVTILYSKASQEAKALYLKAYDEAKALYLKVYDEAKAKTFAELYLKENT